MLRSVLLLLSYRAAQHCRGFQSWVSQQAGPEQANGSKLGDVQQQGHSFILPVRAEAERGRLPDADAMRDADL